MYAERLATLLRLPPLPDPARRPMCRAPHPDIPGIQPLHGRECLQAAADEQRDRDDLAPIKGVALAVILSSAFWIILGCLLLWR